MPVLLVTGVMAAGKSTVAQLVAERLPRSLHLRGDAFRRMTVSGRADPAAHGDAEEWQAQLLLRYRAAAAVADLYAEAGWTAVVQDVMVGPALDDALAAYRTRPLHLVVLAPAPAAVTSREQARDKSGYGRGGWTVEAMDRLLREETPQRGLWLDTTQQTPAQTADEILRRLPEAVVH